MIYLENEIQLWTFTSEVYVRLGKWSTLLLLSVYNRVSHFFYTMPMFVNKGLKYLYREAISGTWGVIQYVWVCVLVGVPALIDGYLWWERDFACMSTHCLIAYWTAAASKD